MLVIRYNPLSGSCYNALFLHVLSHTWLHNDIDSFSEGGHNPNLNPYGNAEANATLNPNPNTTPHPNPEF
jgi:hypothetical protein